MYNKTITVTLPLPPSVNGLFAGMKRRFKSKKYKEWTALAEEQCQEELSKYEINPDEWLYARYTFMMPLKCKNGNVKKRDVANYEKATSDFLADNIDGFDDMMIRKMSMEKVDSERNEVECTLTEINE